MTEQIQPFLTQIVTSVQGIIGMVVAALTGAGCLGG